ncbi:Bzip transcription factor Pap1 bound To Dna, partial [Linnemannia elongata AG-77]
RKEQNRAAQRAFRDRKERHLQQLENMIKELKDTHHHAGVRFQRESQQLKSIIESLQSENYYLR